MARPPLCLNRRRTLRVVLLAVAVAATCMAIEERPGGTRVTDVAVQQRGGRATVVVVTFDGPIAGYRQLLLGGAEPRALLRILGIAEAYRPYEIPVDDGRVVRVRIGHHPETDPPEEHLVFDLVDAGVTVTSVEEQGRQLTVVLDRVSATGTAVAGTTPSPPPPVAPTATPAPPTAVPATPSRTATPPASATPPPPSATPPAVTPTLPPTATPGGSLRTKRLASPTPSPPVLRPTPPVGSAEAPSGPQLSEIVISHRDDGSTLVRVTADGPLDRAEVRYLGVRGAPPRHILAVAGMGVPGPPTVLPVRDGLLCEIQVLYQADAQPPRTEVILFLASSGVTAETAAVKGAHVVVHLLPPEGSGAPLECEAESPLRTRRWRFSVAGPPEELGDPTPFPTPRARRR